MRFEDHFSSLDQSYSFGCVLQCLEVQTTNEHWTRQFIDRTLQGSNQNLFKMVTVEGFGFYLNSWERCMIHQQSKSQENRLKMLEALIANEKEKPTLQYLLSPSMNLMDNN